MDFTDKNIPAGIFRPSDTAKSLPAREDRAGYNSPVSGDKCDVIIYNTLSDKADIPPNRLWKENPVRHFLSVLMAVMPVSAAAVEQNGTVINQGATIFIGEEGLNATSLSGINFSNKKNETGYLS